MAYDEPEHEDYEEEVEAEAEQEEESRELTYEEIWDDSALINAWDAAAEEYEVSFSSGMLNRTNSIRRRHTMVPIKVGRQRLSTNLHCACVSSCHLQESDYDIAGTMSRYLPLAYKNQCLSNLQRTQNLHKNLLALWMQRRIHNH